jgi:deoxyribodipyrimidine photolyase-related protein
MNAITIIFPHQLFENNTAICKNRPVVLVEEFLFFRQYNFHKHKLAFHRASMKFYEFFLKERGLDVNYIESKDKRADIRTLIEYLKEKGIGEIHYCDVTDNWLEKRILEQVLISHIKAVRYNSPLFILSTDELKEYFDTKKRYFQTDFYIQQRKRFRILVDKQLKPKGSQWTYDIENRLKYPKKKKAPTVFFPKANEFWREAVEYVSQHFPDNYGELNPQFTYPTTFAESQTWLDQFLQKRFSVFGDYEDAIVAREHILHHSVLTPMLNVGLLSSREIINKIITHANENDIPLNSQEGFIRQVLGWREFIRGVYESRGTEERTRNFWGFNRKIPPSFWNGTTGISPVDITIKKVLATGYCHHIERLMVLGNFMLLCEFDPDEVYKWFMELFIDAYDWVMVPNIYGMSQFADGGLMATKPYISGSNYLMKMSDYHKGDWQKTWDGLFWRFLDKHRNFFLKNPRLGMLVKTFDKMEDSKKKAHWEYAERFIATLR